jgi:hypothetical protein
MRTYEQIPLSISGPATVALWPESYIIKPLASRGLECRCFTLRPWRVERRGPQDILLR